MAKTEKKGEKKVKKAAPAKSIARPVKPVPATSKEILAKAQAQVPTVSKFLTVQSNLFINMASQSGKQKMKPSKKPTLKASSDSSDADSESEEDTERKAANGKVCIPSVMHQVCENASRLKMILLMRVVRVLPPRTRNQKPPR